MDGDFMNYEEQILELKKRIEVLEGAERKRIVKRRREICFKLVKFILVTTLLVSGGLYLYNNYVKPYKKKIDTYIEKIDTVESYIDNKWDIIQDFNPFQ